MFKTNQWIETRKSRAHNTTHIFIYSSYKFLVITLV